MTPYRNAPIKRKLLGIIVATTALALCFAGAGILLVDSLLFHSAMDRDLTALASIVGDNSSAALFFDDPKVATETLDALHARTHIVSACLYKPAGRLFAHYYRPDGPQACPSPRTQAGVESTSEGLVVTHPITVGGSRAGTLVALYDRGEVWQRLRLYTGIVLLILLASSLFAVLVSSGLREAMTAPISRLASAAATVSESGDYSVRVEKETADELGVLVDAFNEMLGHVQARDLEVQNARNSLETTLTSIGDAVIATDSEGRVSFANPVAKSLLRWSTPDLIGKPIEEVFCIENEYTRETVASPVRRVLAEGGIEGLANHTILVARDGTEVPIDDSAAPIRQGDRTIGVVLVFRDITERRRAQQDAAYLASIVESSEDAIIGKSIDGVIQTWNTGAERLYGFTAEEVVGRHMLELVPEDRKHEESDILERLRAGDRVVHFETVRLRKDRSTVEVSLTVSPIRDRAGQVVGISHVARDITDQKRTAEQIRQTQKLESLGVLAGGIAHDFNNLLTGILGNTSIAIEELPQDSQTREPLQAVITASERAAQLAQQMLAYSGKGKFIVEQMSLSRKAREILPLIQTSIRPNIELKLLLDEDLPPIDADAAQMQQLIMNVIINGAEAVPEGSPGRLTVATRRQEVGEDYGDGGIAGGSELKPGHYVVFEVTDTGSGMDEETLSRIFDPFFTTKFTGRGLGLAAVLGIVRGHRGAVEVSSTPGKGTTFRFLFPVAEGGGQSKAPIEKIQEPDLHGSGAILVVDDEPVVRTMAKNGLERYGYTVLLAENGARGVEIYSRDNARIRCVVLDLTMPLMGGEEALAQMKAIRADIPVILSSGFNEVQAIQRFQGKGLAGFLQKPYRASALLEKVKSVVTTSAAKA